MHSDMLRALTGTVRELMDAGPGPDPAINPTAGDTGGNLLFGYGASDVLTMFCSRPGWTVHVPGHPDEVRRVVLDSVDRGERAYIHVSPRSNSEPRGLGDGRGFETVREGRSGVVVAVGPLLDPVLRATAGLDLAVLYTATIRPFDSAGLRTEVLAADQPNVVLVEPCARGTSSHYVAEALLHVPHRLLALGTDRDDKPVGPGRDDGGSGDREDEDDGLGAALAGGSETGTEDRGTEDRGTEDRGPDDDGLDDGGLNDDGLADDGGLNDDRLADDGLDEESIAAAVRDFMR
ncbi:hypothetical protein H1V43_06645 [Streptomyces sp. PSKA54]|uniref:Transketolase n=1 Tax=Streptomyces himalayensis subsp. aureolus TaxID=2758039 RepID=A0A7W2CXR3_9ACTN|nr:hypothetical protein [Streptomyces himalayensis]MBA4861065.1 hypothetical protein [Streptomyces himalayensis subsp. aureolus]